MAAGEDGTLDALKCAACSCHRNFHRKETNIQQQQQCHQPHQQAVHNTVYPPTPLLPPPRPTARILKHSSVSVLSPSAAASSAVYI
ncbi:putative transcription factor ZF-HD family [Helianthus annuus]|nr:putative transcription factor ZF-HD family [Helianthus annuus]